MSLRAWREGAGCLLLVVASVVFTLGGLELVTRLRRGPETLLHWPNIVRQERPATYDWGCVAVNDPLLGWLPCRNFHSPDYNTDADGHRPMPPLPAAATDLPAVLATGDSFTEGDEVADAETYPFYLQERLGRRVLNRGVSAYGLDQTVLRTEILARRVTAAAIVVSFISDDLRRMEFSRMWSRGKPYFALDGDRLELKGVPVPPIRPSTDTLNPWQKLFGWSALIDEVAGRFGLKEAWLFDNFRVAPPGTGYRMACPSIQRLAALHRPILMVGEYSRSAWEPAAEANDGARQRANVRHVLDCATEAGLQTLDTYDIIERAVKNRGIDDLYRGMHHAPLGNRLVANAVAARLHTPGLLP